MGGALRDAAGWMRENGTGRSGTCAGARQAGVAGHARQELHGSHLRIIERLLRA